MITVIHGSEGERLEKPKWYAVYTRAQHEKVAATLIEAKGFRVFLPRQEVLGPVSRWNRDSLALPLFPGYVFTNFCWSPGNAHKIKATHGVVSIVGRGCNPDPIPDDQIHSVEQLLIQRIKCRPIQYLTRGQRVIIKAGPMRGLSGLVVKHKKRTLFVIALELLHRSLCVDIDLGSLEVVN